ncbi:alpha/beta hydrolase, partial [Frankia canadensis]|uniref:alpha/beta hydrolase n=1 Tax=Frankia canadensis TaxID=1836972 RepID=UPI000C7D65CA
MRPVQLAADRCELSGLLAMASGPPRGTIVALHGGGMNARYFHGEAVPELSLLTFGADAGWNVLALDRPGYRASAGLPDADVSLAAQTEIVFSALDGFAAAHEIGAGLFVLGHSYGFKLGLHLAAHPRGGELLGVDGSGVGRRYQPGRHHSTDPDAPQPTRAQSIDLFWGPLELYPQGTFSTLRGVVEPIPAAEQREAPTWSAVFPGLASQVRTPVRLTLAEHERWWTHGEEELAEIARAFSSAPVVETVGLAGAGHNISLGWAARGYHLAALAFAERCRLRARPPARP